MILKQKQYFLYFDTIYEVVLAYKVYNALSYINYFWYDTCIKHPFTLFALSVISSIPCYFLDFACKCWQQICVTKKFKIFVDADYNLAIQYHFLLKS